MSSDIRWKVKRVIAGIHEKHTMTHSHQDPQRETSTGTGVLKTRPTNRFIDPPPLPAVSQGWLHRADPSYDLLQMSNSIAREFTAKADA